MSKNKKIEPIHELKKNETLPEAKFRGLSEEEYARANEVADRALSLVNKIINKPTLPNGKNKNEQLQDSI